MVGGGEEGGGGGRKLANNNNDNIITLAPPTPNCPKNQQSTDDVQLRKERMTAWEMTRRGNRVGRGGTRWPLLFVFHWVIVFKLSFYIPPC